MVRLSETDLNSVLEVLSQWESIFEAENIDVEALLNEPDFGGPE